MTADPAATDAEKTSLERPAINPWISFSIIAAVVLVILFFLERPQGIEPQGWSMLAIFAGTVLALMLRPIAAGAAVLIGLTVTILTGTLPVSQALTGFSSTTVWLVMAAFMIARALINSGLAGRISLVFVRQWGRTSLGLGYSLVASDLILAGIIPSNSARVGGILFPITRTLAVIYKSLPGASASLLGAYLMLTIYHGDIVACAMFLTGQAGNPIGAEIARKTAGIAMSWSSWLWASIVPGMAAIIVVPWVVFRLSPPEIRHTPEASDMARKELAEMGPLSRNEWVVLFVFCFVCGCWATAKLHRIETTTIALAGAGILFATRTLTWHDAVREHVAWDLFVWYGGMIRMGEALNDFGVTSVFARWIASHFHGWQWPTLMVVIVLIYFYSHYAFASLTTHFISMYGPFLAVLVAAGAPAHLAAYALVFFTNLSASLTHYGTVHSPIIFGAGYVSHGEWWKVGLLISFVNLTIWTSIGLVWWKIIGLW